MIKLRKSADRGHFDFGWLDTRHTFSFGDYRDHAHMGWSVLRVINEDRVAAGKGFEQHGHRDMEIISYIMEGALEHRDSMGNVHVMRTGDVQRMSAGRGVQHSEKNHLADQQAYFLQIWILPNQKALDPGYAQKSFEKEISSGALTLIVSPSGRDGSLSMNQDAEIWACRSAKNKTHALELSPGRKAWVQLVSGEIELNGDRLTAGDGAAIESETSLKLKGLSEANELLVFNLPP